MPGRVTLKTWKKPPAKREGIGDRLARIRRERGVSQADLGKKIGVVQRVVSFYETGSVRIPADTLLRIADVLNVSVYELLGRASSKRPTVSKPLQEALKKIESLPPSDLKAVLRYIDLMARDANGGT